MKFKGFACAVMIALAVPAFAQGPRVTATPQKLDEEYTARIVARQRSVARRMIS